MAVVALLTDVALRLRLADALKGWSAPAECIAQVRDVRARLAGGDVRVLVVGPRDACARPAAPLVGDVRRDHPGVTVVAYCAGGTGSSDDILALVGAGAHALVVRGVDDERHAFRAALRGAEQRCTAALVFDRIRDQLPPAVAPLVALYLRADGVPPSVAEAAELLGVHRKTLVNRLAAAGCPPPRVLRTWCRLFVASRLLEEPGRTVESIAHQLEFDSTTGLRNALKRYTGHGAGAVRAAGGLAYVLARFTAACATRGPERSGPAPRRPLEPSLASVIPADAVPPAPVDAGEPACPARPGAARRALAGVADVAARVLVVAGAFSLSLTSVDDLLCMPI
ncbi:hypothetical protein tb265_12140 [Gemmatimonadetes bacterium T265]|nr:hypothetical protein tb265_12140 [Gemmatimonadetes bacterium T265]